MNVFERVQQPIGRILSSPVALLLIISMLLWMTGAPFITKSAHAQQQLTNVSDTLSESGNGALATHTVRFTTGSSTPAGGTIKIQFDAAGSAFSEVGSAATSTDITAVGMTVVNNVGACAGGTTVYPLANYNNGTDENITFTVCPGATVAAGAKTITIGAVTQLITNPAATGSYRITVTGSNGDYGDTQVAVLPNVTMTASVNTIFTFTVSGVATGTVINGVTTTGSTTATAIPFGTITPGAGGAKVLGQLLTVNTNAANGFSVTVQQNQPLTSGTGATIDNFVDGFYNSSPIVWQSPSAQVGSSTTYGHIGLTSDDAVDSAGAEFVGSKFVGNYNTPRQVFYNPTPVNGTGVGVGTTSVAYKVEISNLQEAGTDYINTLRYVATPTF